MIESGLGVCYVFADTYLCCCCETTVMHYVCFIIKGSLFGIFFSGSACTEKVVRHSTRSSASALNQRKGIRARHNQLLNTTSVILKEYGALLQQLQTGSDPRLYGPTVKEVVQLPVEESVDQNSSISVFFRITMWISHSMYGPFESRLSVVSNGHCNEKCEETLQHEPYGISKEPEEVLEVRGQGELNTYKVLKARLTDSLHAGLALGDLNSVKDLYDFKTLSIEVSVIMTNEESVKDMTSKFDKLAKFEGQDFHRWQKKMHFLLTTLKVVYVLSTPSPVWSENETFEMTRKRMKW
ncbi:hypothetical protein Tco_1408031 [Tanacetum coccineum]